MKGLFIGAGFSHETGMPLVWELTKEFKNYLTPEKLKHLNESWRQQGGGFCDKTILKIIKLLETNDIHYESLIGGIEVEEDRYENRDIRDELHHVRMKILDMIFFFLHQRIVKNEIYIQFSIGMYRGFKSLIAKDYPLWIFSLNHDMLIEMLASEFNIPLKNGFSEEITQLRFGYGHQLRANFKTLNFNQEIKSPYNYFSSHESGINLLKIHGSLDIFGYDDLRCYLCITPEEKSVTGYIRMLNSLMAPSLNLLKIDNEIVVFDDKGEMQFLRKSILSGVYKFKTGRYQVMPSKILDVFKANLNYVEELIVMGYGFGDIHINLIFKDWLEFTSKRKMVIINKNQANVPDFMRHLSHQVLPKKEDTIDYLSSLPSGALTQYQVAMRKIRQEDRNKLKI